MDNLFFAQFLRLFPDSCFKQLCVPFAPPAATVSVILNLNDLAEFPIKTIFFLLSPQDVELCPSCLPLTDLQ